MNYPFDERLIVGFKAKNKSDSYQIPFDEKKTISINGLHMTLAELDEKRSGLLEAGWTQKEFDAVRNKQETIIEDAKKNVNLSVQNALMNPYAKIKLIGTNRGDDISTNYLIDSSSHRPWYEVDIKDSTSNIGYSKYPTTARIIDWGNSDSRGRTPYQFQDFVFSKWWNKIPNNRLITLRRYSMPIYDNFETVYDPEGEDENLFPPVATAVTYFGEDTGNSLKDILKFTTGLNWGDVSANVWTVDGGPAVSINEAMSGAGNALGLEKLFSVAGNALTGLSILNNDISPNGLIEKNGLPPDPYQNGPYENRILGPVNRIDAVKKREAGLKFEMSGLKIKFDYVARPIGGINSKAVLLDILSNFMLMGSASAIFFGGAHRFRIQGCRFPANKNSAIRKLYSGDLEGGINDMFKQFTNTIEGGGESGGFLNMLMETAKGLLSDLLGAIGNPFGLAVEDTENEGAQTAKEGIKNAVIQKMHTGMRYPYLQGMRALLIGEPVGEWHLTIGNPMNPIVTIGNLICTGIDVEIDDAQGLGPDDFPLGFTITVSLEHGMARDKDAIESMFNRGGGRIYELDIETSADKQTRVDRETLSKHGIASGSHYGTTQTSEKAVTMDLAMHGDPAKIGEKRSLITNDVDKLKLSAEDIQTRVPKHAEVNWITKKGIK